VNNLNSKSNHQVAIKNVVPSYWSSMSKQNMYLLVVDPTYSIAALKIDVNTSFDKPNGGFCGYHSTLTIGSIDYSYGVVGTSGIECQWNMGGGMSRPQAGFVDVTVSVMAHEIGEMFTNPFGGGWYDTLGNENGDKCIGTPKFALYVSGTAGSSYNATIGPKKYLLQAQYHLTGTYANGCPDLIYN